MKGMRFLLVIIFLTVCTSSFAQSNNKYFTSFFKGKGQHLFFVKPIDFRSQNGTLQLQIDFTVSTVDSDSVIVNFSVIKNDKEKLKFEEMLIQNGDSKLTLESPEYLYFEKRKKNYLSRYTAKCTTQQLIKLFESSKWVIGFNDNDSHFLPSKKFTKNCSILNEEVFSVYF